MSSGEHVELAPGQQKEVPSTAVDSATTLKGMLEKAPARIPSSLSITGNIDSTDNLQIDGELKGDLVCKGLVIISENSHVTGNIVADEACIRGRVLGSIRAARVRLAASSHVEGDIFYQMLGVEPGARFKGKMDLNTSAGAVPEEEKQLRPPPDAVEARATRRAAAELGLVKPIGPTYRSAVPA